MMVSPPPPPFRFSPPTQIHTPSFLFLECKQASKNNNKVK